MAEHKAPTTIKKYANRRLYHTGTSTYVTLEDLAVMVRGGEDFVVFDAKSGDDITRSVLTQIIFEQEGKEGQNLLPITFLRQLIRFYGDSLQVLVPSYLEFSMDNLSREKQTLRDQMAQTFPAKAFHAMEDQVRANMAFFTDAMRVFAPFAERGGLPGGSLFAGGLPAASPPAAGAPASPEKAVGELDELKAQMAAMQEKLEALSKK